jgi:hypothetical protein
MNIIEATHLVVNGCSWTYGHGLPDPKTQAWPALLAQHLNLPLVNLAIPGSGNDTIHRRTHEYIFQNLPTGSKPIVVIAWSQSHRKEEWYQKDRSYRGIGRPQDSENLDDYQKILLENWNEDVADQRTLLYKMSLKNLFENFKIPYIMSDYCAYVRRLGRSKLDYPVESYRQMINTIYDQYHVASFEELGSRLPKLPCGHDGPEAQRIIGNYSFKKITELYGNVLPVASDNFLTYRQFLDTEVSKFPKCLSLNLDWV